MSVNGSHGERLHPPDAAPREEDDLLAGTRAGDASAIGASLSDPPAAASGTVVNSIDGSTLSGSARQPPTMMPTRISRTGVARAGERRGMDSTNCRS